VNKKQQAWSMNKVYNSRKKISNIFSLLIIGILAMFVVGSVIDGTLSIDSLFGIGSGASLALFGGFATFNGNPGNQYNVGKQVKNKFYFISQDQYDDTISFPSRVGREIGNIPLKAGQYWNKIDTILDSPEIKWTGEQGDVASKINNELTFILGGMGDDIFTLLEQGIGKGFYLVFEVCATGDKFIAGNACKPVKMTNFDGGSGKDQTATTVTFKVECGEVWSKYTGNTPTQAAATVAADATTIGLTSNPEYQLASGTSAAAAITAFTGTTDADINRIVTILGSGGSHPSTISNTATAFLLIGGAQWVANSGSQISFKIFKDGASSYKFVEVAGSRV
jgi:hypothetical protein